MNTIIKKSFIFLLYLSPSVFAQDGSDGTSDNTNPVNDPLSSFKTNFISSNEDAVKDIVYNFPTNIINLYGLSEQQKRDYLTQEAQNMGAIHCENLAPYVRSCKIETTIANKIIGDEPVYVNKIYFGNVKDYIEWQSKKDVFLEKNCTTLNHNFYKTLDTITDTLGKSLNDGKQVDPKEVIPTLTKNKIVLPAYSFYIETDRKQTAYSCLDSKWGPMLTYRQSEHTIDKDCHSSQLVVKLGLSQVCQ